MVIDIVEPVHFEIISDDFECEELESVYCKGLRYVVHPGNTRLAKYLDRWVAAGKAKFVPNGGSVVIGKGSINS